MRGQPEVVFVGLASFTPPAGGWGHFLFSAHGVVEAAAAAAGQAQLLGLVRAGSWGGPGEPS